MRFFNTKSKYSNVFSENDLQLLKEQINIYNNNIPTILNLKKSLKAALSRDLTNLEQNIFYDSLMLTQWDYYEFTRCKYYMFQDVFNKRQFIFMAKFLKKHSWEYLNFDEIKENLFNGVLKKKDFLTLKHFVNKPVSNYFTFNKIKKIIQKCSVNKLSLNLLTTKKGRALVRKFQNFRKPKPIWHIDNYEWFFDYLDFLDYFKVTHDYLTDEEEFYWMSDIVEDLEKEYAQLSFMMNYVEINSINTLQFFNFFFKKLVNKSNTNNLLLKNSIKFYMITYNLTFDSLLTTLLLKNQKINIFFLKNLNYPFLQLGNFNFFKIYNYLLYQIFYKYDYFLKIPTNTIYYFPTKKIKLYYLNYESSYIYLAEKNLYEADWFIHTLGTDNWDLQFLADREYKYIFKTYHLFKHIKHYIMNSNKFPKKVKISALSWWVTWNSAVKVNLLKPVCYLKVFGDFLNYYYNLRDLCVFYSLNINNEINLYQVDIFNLDTALNQKKNLKYTFFYYLSSWFIQLYNCFNLIFKIFKTFLIKNLFFFDINFSKLKFFLNKIIDKSIYLIIKLKNYPVFYFKLNKRILSWKKYARNELSFLDLDEEIRQKRYYESLYQTRIKSRKFKR